MALSRDQVRQLVWDEAVRQNVDPTLATRLAFQESRFNPDARSKAGAIGTMQLMPGTARDLGVDPDDVQQNIVGGIRYLKQQLTRFGGDPRLALAAYNAGPGAVEKHGGVPPYKETQGYVQAILGEQGQPSPWFATRQAPPRRDWGQELFTTQATAEEGIAPLRVTPEEGLGDVTDVAQEATAPEAASEAGQVRGWWGLLGETAPAQDEGTGARRDWGQLLFG